MIRRNVDPQPGMLHAIMDAHVTSADPAGVDKCFGWSRAARCPPLAQSRRGRQCRQV